MTSVSIFHWLVLLLITFLTVWPCFRILRKMGYPGWWAVLALVPLVNVIGFYILAFVRWPVEDRAR